MWNAECDLFSLSDKEFPLTLALSPQERENRSQVIMHRLLGNCAVTGFC